MKWFCLYFVVFLQALFIFSSCKDKSKKGALSKSIKDTGVISHSYDVNHFDERLMKKELNEISGIHYLKENTFVAIADEKAKIFTVDFLSGEILSELEFGKKGDYEDITMDSEFYYVMESDGTIYQVAKSGDNSTNKKFIFPGKGSIEFESMYLDIDGKNLVLICKNCPGKMKVFHAYSFNLQSGQFNQTPIFTLDVSVLEDKPADFKPSAAAIHPIEKKLYVLCSVGKLLLVCDLQGKVEKWIQLDEALYGQPEGIAFAPNGDMFISNEAANSKANIMKLVYR